MDFYQKYIYFRKKKKQHFTSLNEYGVSPAIVVDDVSCEGSDDNGSDAGAADCNASRQGTPSLKVEASRDHRWHINQPEPYPWNT